MELHSQILQTRGIREKNVIRAEVINLMGSSYHLRHTQVDSLPSTRPENTAE